MPSFSKGILPLVQRRKLRIEIRQPPVEDAWFADIDSYVHRSRRIQDVGSASGVLLSSHLQVVPQN